MMKPPQSPKQVFGSVRGVNWSRGFSLRHFFFSCARKSCALSEYPRGVNWYNDIFETRARFQPGSPRKMMKPPQSPKQVFGSVRGVNWSRSFSLRHFFFSCARKSCAFSEYPRGVNWYNDIFETRARFQPGSPRKMMKPPQSPKQVFGSVRGVNWSRRFSLRHFFFSCARESCAFSEYPRGVNWYNDIFETRARF